MSIYVNVYEISRNYGGPEEGGWYFDAGVPVTSILVELTDDENADLTDAIEQYEHRYDRWVEREQVFTVAELNKVIRTHRDLQEQYPATGKSSSVLGGEDYRVLVEDHYGKAWDNYQPWE